MIETNDREAYTTTPETHRLRRPADPEAYFTRCTLLPRETAEDFEEIPLDEIPQDETLNTEELNNG